MTFLPTLWFARILAALHHRSSTFRRWQKAISQETIPNLIDVGNCTYDNPDATKQKMLAKQCRITLFTAVLRHSRNHSLVMAIGAAAVSNHFLALWLSILVGSTTYALLIVIEKSAKAPLEPRTEDPEEPDEP